MEILKKILQDKINRKKLIKEFQEMVWNSEKSHEILKDLAYDLDFYEPDDVLREGDPSYYGEERLEKGILLAIEKLKTLDSKEGI